MNSIHNHNNINITMKDINALTAERNQIILNTFKTICVTKKDINLYLLDDLSGGKLHTTVVDYYILLELINNNIKLTDLKWKSK